MLQHFFDQRTVRILFGVALGLPITALALIGGLYGCVIGLTGLLTGSDKFLFAFITATTFLGLAGISGAWRRILRPSVEMTASEIKTIQALLWAGVLSSFCLAGGVAHWSEPFWLVFAFVGLGLAGIVLVLATPRPNPSLQPTASSGG